MGSSNTLGTGELRPFASPPCYLAEFNLFDEPPTSMKTDTLYLIRPDFHSDGRGPFYCPGCAEVLGLLEHYPVLKERISIQYVDFARPRPELVERIGASNQSCPALVLAEPPQELPDSIILRKANGWTFVEGAREIGAYLAQAHGTGMPY